MEEIKDVNEMPKTVVDVKEKERHEMSPHQSTEGTSVDVQTLKEDLRKRETQVVHDSETIILNKLSSMSNRIAFPQVSLKEKGLDINEVEDSITGKVIITASFNDATGLRKLADIEVSVGVDENGNQVIILNEESFNDLINSATEVKVDDSTDSLSDEKINDLSEDAADSYSKTIKDNYPDKVIQEAFTKTAGLMEDSFEDNYVPSTARAPKSFSVVKAQLPSNLKLNDVVNIHGLQYEYVGDENEGTLAMLMLKE